MSVPERLDVLIVGTGIAGLSAALSLAGPRRVAVVAKQAGGGGSTQLAQGGIAAALAPGDTALSHAADTVAAAAGLGDPDLALAIAGEAVEAVATLARLGAHFDPGALAREGGHSHARVAHARGDATGAEITRALMSAASDRGVAVHSGLYLVDLVTTPDGRGVTGALLWDGASGALRSVLADNVVLATGGYGQLWSCTTSSVACTGDGVAAALRAGAQVADLELAQFHPTGLDVGLDPRPLASEALRGAGARLRDCEGVYLNGPGGEGDLAPRDVVSRAMAKRMGELGSGYCFLDATPLGPSLPDRFPTFYQACVAAGLDPAHQWVPVSPTTHYTMGGVLTDDHGRTTLDGLLAIGEVASSGLHGANRLASNSLLEGVVMGRRAAALLDGWRGPVPSRPAVPVRRELDLVATGPPGPVEPLDRDQLRRAMQADAGVARDAQGLARLMALLSAPLGPSAEAGPARFELANMVLVAQAVAALAARRCESRGAHWRTDHPHTEPKWQCRQVLQLDAGCGAAVGDLRVPAAGQGGLAQQLTAEAVGEPAAAGPTGA